MEAVVLGAKWTRIITGAWWWGDLHGPILERDVEVRLRPGFFPFVEPGFELDVNCPFCSGKGCSVCKQIGWIEILPCSG